MSRHIGQMGNLKLRYSCFDYLIKDAQRFQNMLSLWGLLTLLQENENTFIYWVLSLKRSVNRSCPDCALVLSVCCFTFVIHAEAVMEEWAGFQGCHRFFVALQEGDASGMFSFGVCFEEPVNKDVCCWWGRTDNQVLYRGRNFSPELEICKNLSSTSHCFLTMWLVLSTWVEHVG